MGSQFQLHIEVTQKVSSCYPPEAVALYVGRFLEQQVAVVPGTTYLGKEFYGHTEMEAHVDAVTICDANQERDSLEVRHLDNRYHIYRLCQMEPDEENINGDEEGLPAGKYWQLPSQEFFGLWESLIYDTAVKEETLNFVETTLLFSDRGIDPNILNWNRVILLHGPPGTGKTSLCQALAQKLSIRLNYRYPRTQLVEINSHSLFSKWFSESGKLVMKLFQRIRDLAEDPEILLCILIDEVESLTHARTAAFSGSDPSDSIRVVNAILTQLDNIRRYPNVLVLTTSNMTGAIDIAFIDRADIKQYIGPPSTAAIYQIYLSCLYELMKKGIITPAEQFYTYKMLEVCQFLEDKETKLSLQLLELAKSSDGMSGRSLRKIPFVAHAIYISTDVTTVGPFFKAMKLAIVKYKNDSTLLVNGK